MRIVENLPPPLPPRTFDLMDVTVEELRELRFALSVIHRSPTETAWNLYQAIALALGDDEG